MSAEHTLRRLIYLSRAQVAVDQAMLDGLVENASRNNLDGAVSGALIYSSGHFLQWLEGPDGSVGEVWAKIRVDPRHAIVDVIADDPVADRKYAQWGMLQCLGDAAFLSADTPLPNVRSAGVAQRLFELSSPSR